MVANGGIIESVNASFSTVANNTSCDDLTVNANEAYQRKEKTTITQYNDAYGVNPRDQSLIITSTNDANGVNPYICNQSTMKRSKNDAERVNPRDQSSITRSTNDAYGLNTRDQSASTNEARTHDTLPNEEELYI